MDTLIYYTKNLFYLGGGLILGSIGYLYFFQNKLIYIPDVLNNGSKKISDNPSFYKSPKEYDLEYKDIFISHDNIKLYGWLIYISEQDLKHNPTIVFFHENAGNIGLRLPYISYLVKSLNINFIIVGYRGYGESEGSPSEEGIKKDSISILNYVFDSFSNILDMNKIVLMGRSLGGATAIYAQSKLKKPIKGVIIENTFMSLSDLVDDIFPFIKYFKRFLLKNHWETKKIIGNIDVPIFFIIAEKDELIPCKHMHELIKLSTGKSRYIQKLVIKNAGHNDSFLKDKEGYINEMRNFLNMILGE